MNWKNRLFVTLALFGFLILALQSRSRAGRIPYRPNARPPYAAATPAPTPIPTTPPTIPSPNKPPISPPDTKNYIHPSRGEMYNMIVNLGKPAHVQVDVYTIQGKKVKGLLDSDLAAGSHTVSWDGKNEDGSSVSSDMYVVLIYQDGHLSQKKKVIIER